MLTKDGKEVKAEALTAENYLVPKGEEKVYHVLQEVKEFDRKTGRKISVARVQKYGRKTFEKVMYDQLLKQGYEFKVLYNPTGYLTALAAKRAEAAAAAKAKQEADLQAKIDAALEAHEKSVQARIDAAVKAALAKKEAKKSGEE